MLFHIMTMDKQKQLTKAIHKNRSWYITYRPYFRYYRGKNYLWIAMITYNQMLVDKSTTYVNANRIPTICNINTKSNKKSNKYRTFLIFNAYSQYLSLFLYLSISIRKIDVQNIALTMYSLRFNKYKLVFHG